MKKQYIIALGLLAMLICSTLTVTATPSIPQQLSGWQYRKMITIDHTKVAGVLTDFPVLINIVNSDLSSETQVNGNDIVFTTVDGTKLNHEIEKFVQSTGELVCWVNVPLLSASADTKLYMYYGNPTCGNQQNSTAVWDSNYVMVQHFKEQTGMRFDSTSHHFDATPTNVTHASLGIIGDADSFDGSSSYLFLGRNSTLQPLVGSISVWLNATATNGFRTIYTGSTGRSFRRQPRLGISNGAVRLVLTNNVVEEWHFKGNTLSPNVVHFVTVSWNGTRAVLYIDGVVVKSEKQTIVPAGSTNRKRVGGLNPPWWPDAFSGILDELLVSNIPRSAEWVKTSYTNQYNPLSFYTISSEEVIAVASRSHRSSNHAPSADGSASEPYTGFIGEELIFNGSRSYDTDGSLISWQWSFGDGTGTNGVVVTHAYADVGTYAVVLIVTDNAGASDTYETVAHIRMPNRPPLQPQLTGPIQGVRNTSYVYSVVTTDPDNDDVRYTFEWGDGSQNTSPLFKSGHLIYTIHQWNAAGLYRVRLYVTDPSNATSVVYEVMVSIDTQYVGSFGYLINTNSVGPFDAFYSNQTGKITSVQQQQNGGYLIDTNGDGTVDYQFNTVSSALGAYPEQLSTEYMILLVGLGVVLLLIVLVSFLSKRKKTRILRKRNHL
jgi:hypothetical protein